MLLEALLHFLRIRDCSLNITETWRSKISVVDGVQYLWVFVFKPAVGRCAFHVVGPTRIAGDSLKDAWVLSRIIVVLSSIVFFSDLAVEQIAIVLLCQKQTVVGNLDGLKR